jgi:hypothetical protein
MVMDTMQIGTISKKGKSVDEIRKIRERLSREN